MAFKGYSIKIPEAGLIRVRNYKRIRWVCRLGKYEDDIHLQGVTVSKIAEGWRYSIVDVLKRPIHTREFSKGNAHSLRSRDPREGDYYVMFDDGTWTVMHPGYLRWYKKKYEKQLADEITRNADAQQLLHELNGDNAE